MMTNEEIIRAWKADEDDRKAKKDKKDKKKEQVPPSPVGQIELNNEELTQVSGGTGTCWPFKNPSATDESDALFGKR